MWPSIALLLLFVGSSNSAIAVYEAKVGDCVVLDLGQDVVTWKRVRKEGVDEFIKHCGPTEKGPRCAQFVTLDNEPALPESSAHVAANGSLIIDPLQATDVGLYSSPERGPIAQKQPDGTITSVLGMHISLVLKDDNYSES